LSSFLFHNRPTDILKGRLREAFSQREEEREEELQAGLLALHRLRLTDLKETQLVDEDRAASTPMQQSRRILEFIVLAFY
jgi:hypothetical protein